MQFDSFHLQESIRTVRARLHTQHLHTHDLRASLTIVSLVFCALAVFLLSSVADGLDSVLAEILGGLGKK